jgi:hypothetical protein
MFVKGDSEANSGDNGTIGVIAEGAGIDQIGSNTQATEEGFWFSLSCLR